MLVTKCDLCKREIKNRQDVVVGLGWPEFALCGRYGKPIIAFLQKRKLLPKSDKD